MIKKLKVLSLSFLASLIFSFNANAQSIDSITIDGKQVYIYPFEKSVRTHSAYSAILDIEKDYIKQMDAYYKRLKSGDESVSVKELEYMAALDKWINPRYSSSEKMKRKHLKAMRANPYPMLIQSYSLESDIIPVLDPIPDGEYIQYFETFCLTDEKGNCKHQSEIVAGRFSMKNNALHGEATWFNLQGDTLKHGFFNNGQKEGVWILEQQSIDYSLTESDLNSYLENGHPDIDTTVEYVTYAEGAKNGKYERYFMSDFPVETGNFKDGVATGTWEHRSIEYSYFPPDFQRRYPKRHNDIITKKYTFSEDKDTTIVRQPLIRKGLVKLDYNLSQHFSLMTEEPLPAILPGLFDVAFSKPEDLDLYEEKFDSHAMGDLRLDDYDYRRDHFDIVSYDPRVTVYDPETLESFKRGKAIDSLGMTANYQGVIEMRYFNGNRGYQYEFENGKLKSEDTIFWSNGVAHDVITKIADSNYYLRSIYDADGKLYQSLIYDSLGDFVDYDFRFDGTEYFDIEGFSVPVGGNSYFYSYQKWDTLFSDLQEPTVVAASWSKEDYSRVFYSQFDPKERMLSKQDYSVNGELFKTTEVNFGKEFENWTGSTVKNFGPYQAVVKKTGAIREYSKLDTLKIGNVQRYESAFLVAEDYTLMLNGVPYTGEVNIDATARKTKLSNDELKISLDSDLEARNWERLLRKREKEILKRREKGKPTKSRELDLLQQDELASNYGQIFCMEFLPSNVLDQLYDIREENYFSYYNPTIYGKLEGYMLDGKPHGTWKLSSVKGRIIKEVNFENGELNGTARDYALQSPFLSASNARLAAVLNDSLPDEFVEYLSIESEYKNDRLNGKYTEYDWLGNEVLTGSYKEGFQDGLFIERNKLICSYTNFKNGLYEGYYQTYLTLPEKDSILLYDLNFQDGSLQGKSQAYHVNGELAKKGFFLNGQPIDDYEAYDSLGFRYHYVKFKYSFPVEEKLWEENELSVRYLFDWEDSILFVPDDITQTESLEGLIADLGLIDDYLSKPYFGRSTLVDKFGIKCRMTKYYANDNVARDGDLNSGKKVGLWKYYDYEGQFLYQVDYFDTIFSLNDSIRFKSKGILTDVNQFGDTLYKAHIIEKFEKYDCAHTDHYELRQLYTIWQANDSVGRMNGYVQNFYDNGVLQSEGEMKDGLPTGVWKIYDPFGKLNQYGYYVMGKRDGRWLSGDLSKTKYLGDICLNPNLPDLEKEIKYRENLIDIGITNYKLGKALNSQYYDVDMNQFQDLVE